MREIADIEERQRDRAVRKGQQLERLKDAKIRIADLESRLAVLSESQDRATRDRDEASFIRRVEGALNQVGESLRHAVRARLEKRLNARFYTYSLAQGIADGFLAPYRVHRVVTETDAGGWRPSKGELDRYGREIPDEEYQTKDFERVVALLARTEAIARHLTDFLKATDRFSKTIIFCVDQEHASDMRAALSNLNADLVRQYPNYVCRVTSDEGAIGRGHLSDFQDLEKRTPVILTTSQMLTTGVDAPTCRNVVLARVVGSMSEFKQIIGRGTRLREDYGKLFFNIIDYTGTATAKFADPEFDGDPVGATTITIDPDGVETGTIEDPITSTENEGESADPEPDGPAIPIPPGGGQTGEPRKYCLLGHGDRITPLHPLFAARLAGLDLTHDLDDATFAAVHDAVERACVLVFLGQAVTDAQQSA